MNIREHYSKYGYANRLDRDERLALRARHDSRVGDADTSGESESTDFSERLAALVNAEPSQIADVMSAIADELRAAADSSGGSQSGFLDALADRFETVATTVDPTEATNATNTTTGPDETIANVPQHTHHRHHGHHGAFGPRQSEELLAKILDAVNEALTKVTLAPSTTTETQNTPLLATPLPATVEATLAETSANGAA